MNGSAATAVVKTRLLTRERDELAALADRDGRSVASYVRILIRDNLAARRTGERDANRGS